MTERQVRVWNGWTAVGWEVVVFLFLLGFGSLAAWAGDRGKDGALGFFVLLAILSALKMAAMAAGFFIVKPNQSKVLVQFGRYVGTVRDEGFHWTWPWRIRRTLSLRI